MHAAPSRHQQAPAGARCLWQRATGGRAALRPLPPPRHQQPLASRVRATAAPGPGPSPSSSSSSSARSGQGLTLSTSSASSSAHITQQQQQAAASDDEADWRMALQSLTASLVGGVALALVVPVVDDALPAAAQLPSAALGWMYFLAWSISFWPQVLDNASRRSVAGLSPDYLLYSIIGYFAYTLYTAALYLSPDVQAAYLTAHAGSAPDVQLTDLLFAGHALAVSLLTLGQCAAYGAGDDSAHADSSSSSSSSQAGRRGWLSTSPLANATALAVLGGLGGYGAAVSSSCAGGSDCGAWLPLLGFLGTTKVAMTLIKYTPQALLNARRRSTSGWQINNVLLDLAGGLLSFGQIGLNAAARGDVSVVTGNPAKLGIAAVSVAFDLLFIAQHYVLYRTSSSSSSSNTSSTSSSSSSSSGGSGSERDGLGRPAASSSAGRASRRLAAVAVNAAKGRR